MSDTNVDGASINQDASDETPVYRDGKGGFTSVRMRNAVYWAAQADGWIQNGPNAGIQDRTYIEVIGGKPVIVLDKSWNDETTKALVDGLRADGFPDALTIRKCEDETRVFIEPSENRLDNWLTANWYEGDWRDYDVTGSFNDADSDYNHSKIDASRP
jgi:hypothetical protein